jgi:hypothetical protein
VLSQNIFWRKTSIPHHGIYNKLLAQAKEQGLRLTVQRWDPDDDWKWNGSNQYWERNCSGALGNQLELRKSSVSKKYFTLFSWDLQILFSSPVLTHVTFLQVQPQLYPSWFHVLIVRVWACAVQFWPHWLHTFNHVSFLSVEWTQESVIPST